MEGHRPLTSDVLRSLSQGGPITVLSKSKDKLKQLARACDEAGVDHKCVYYSDSYGVDWTLLPRSKAILVFVASSSSPGTWLDIEHNPKSREICEWFRKNGQGLCFLVWPATADARAYWAPGQKPPLHHIFQGFAHHTVLVWDAAHVGSAWHNTANTEELNIIDISVTMQQAGQAGVGSWCTPKVFVFMFIATLMLVAALYLHSEHLHLKALEAEKEELWSVIKALEAENEECVIRALGVKYPWLFNWAAGGFCPNENNTEATVMATL